MHASILPIPTRTLAQPRFTNWYHYDFTGSALSARVLEKVPLLA